MPGELSEHVKKSQGFYWFLLSIAGTAIRHERLEPHDRTADKFFSFLEEFVQRLAAHPEMTETQREELLFLTASLLEVRQHEYVKLLLSDSPLGPIH